MLLHPKLLYMITLFSTLKKNPFISSLSVGLIALTFLSHTDFGLSPLTDYAMFIFLAQFGIGLGAFLLRRYKVMSVAFMACWLLGYALQEKHDAWILMAKNNALLQDTFSVAYVDLQVQPFTANLAKEVASSKADVLLLASYDLEQYPQLDEALRTTYPFGSQLSGQRALFSKNAVFVQNDLQGELVEVKYPDRHFSIATAPSGFLLRRYRDWTASVQLQTNSANQGEQKGFQYTSAFKCIEWKPWSKTIKNAYLGFFQLKSDSLSKAKISKL